MKSVLWDGEKKMDKNTGLLEIAGELTGEKMDSLD